MIVLGVGASLASFFVCCLMIRLGLHDVPGERSSHATPTSRGGGVGIMAGVVGAFFLSSLNGVAFWGPYLAWVSLVIVSLTMGALGFF